MTIRMHKKVKITVLRTEYYQELAEQYAIPNLGKCPFHQKGQVLYSDGINPPDGMCGVAWQVIAPMARQLSLGELFALCLTSPSIRLWWASPLANSLTPVSRYGRPYPAHLPGR